MPPGPLWSVDPGVCHDDLQSHPLPPLDVSSILSVALIVGCSSSIIFTVSLTVLVSVSSILTIALIIGCSGSVIVTVSLTVTFLHLHPLLLQGVLDAGAAHAVVHAADGVAGVS